MTHTDANTPDATKPDAATPSATASDAATTDATMPSAAEIQRINSESAFLLSKDELDLWFTLGHTLDEVKITTWRDASALYDDLSDERRSEFIEHFRAEAANWRLKGLDETLFKAFDFAPDVCEAFRQRAFIDFFRHNNHRFLFSDDAGRSFIDRHVTAELLEERLKADCQTFSEIVTLVRSLSYVGVPLWAEAFEHVNLQLEVVDHLPDISDLPDDKCRFLRELHAQLLQAHLPQSWNDFIHLHNDAAEDAFKRQQLTFITAEGYAHLIETDVDKRKSITLRPIPADKERRRRYDELAKIGEVYLRKKYTQIPTTLAEHATEAILPALLGYCREQFLALLPEDGETTKDIEGLPETAKDSNDNKGSKDDNDKGSKDDIPPEEAKDFYPAFCALVDQMNRYPSLWNIFRRQFVFWSDDQLDRLAAVARRLTASLKVIDRDVTAQRFAAAEERARKKAVKAARAAEKAAADRGEPVTKGGTDPASLYVTPILAEKSVVRRNRYRVVILNIVARLRQSQDPTIKTMATQLEKQTLTERQRTYRKIVGTRPERPLLHWIRAGIICIIFALAGYAAGRITAHFGHKAEVEAVKAQADSLRAATIDSLRTLDADSTPSLLKL